MKVALVHDYLREYGGAERVVEALHEIFPEAPLYTAYSDLSGLGVHAPRFKNWNIKSSWMQNIPFAKKLVSPFRIFAPFIFEGFDLKEFDVVISSCSIYFSKAVITKPESYHISYIHTPPRYLYGYATSFNYKKNPITKWLGEIANHFLRIYDFETSQRPDLLVANSQTVKERIRKFYRRESIVIYPPVDTEEIKTQTNKLEKVKRSYFLSLSRLVRGKGVDLIVKACTELKLPLKVAGTGPEFEHLKRSAGPTIEFVGQVTDLERISLYYGAKAFILASEDEDFGITAVEAMAAGTPVIAPYAGGFKETIINGKTGVFYAEEEKVTLNSLRQALKDFKPDQFSEVDCIKQADNFSKERFKKEINNLIESKLKNLV